MWNISPSAAPPQDAVSLRVPALSANISVGYPGKPRVLQNTEITVFPGEIVGLLGESGSGKSTLALSVLKLLDQTGAQVQGTMNIAGMDISSWNERQMRSIRGRLVAVIPQSPAAALNPALRLETHIKEAWRAHSSEPWRLQKQRVLNLIRHAGLPQEPEFLRRFPGEVSLGQGQRVLIVMALLHSPRLLIADEPTSSLDVITQSEVLALLRSIRDENGLGILFISHDLPTVAAFCDRIAILHEGRIVENGPVHEVLNAPRHPYTRQLVEAAPKWR
jgi:ABC-type glutathione transport system ATPase component